MRLLTDKSRLEPEPILEDEKVHHAPRQAEVSEDLDIMSVR